MTTVNRIRRILLGVLLVLLPSPSRTAAESQPLTVFAAADLAFAFKQIVPLFERATGAKVTLSFGSTGQFAQQIAAGAPADVFFAANQSFIDDLATTGKVLPETRTLYAQGRIVLASRRPAQAKLTDLRQLVDPGVRRVAIANPQHAPYGKAAEQALRAAGVWEGLKSKLVYGENIRHTLQFIQTGAVDAGVVALSVADVPDVTWVVIDTSLHEPLNQSAAVIRTSRRPQLAMHFIQFVVSPAARPIMKRYGFLLPGEF